MNVVREPAGAGAQHEDVAERSVDRQAPTVFAASEVSFSSSPQAQSRCTLA